MKRVFLAVCALALLSGCSTMKSVMGKSDVEPACPMIGVLKGASFAPVLGSDAPHLADADLAAKGKMTGVEYNCSYKHAGEVDMKVTVNFAARRGQKGQKLDEQKFPYFIAILSPDDVILQREVFSTTVDFDNSGFGTSSEKHRLRIPMQDKMKGPDYKVTAGFALDQRQAHYNKENNAD